MKDIEEPAYVLNHREHPESGTRSCANLATLIRSKTRQKKAMDVYVRRVDALPWTHIKAKATISHDRKTITVVVIVGEGQQTFTADADEVMRDISEAHPKKTW